MKELDPAIMKELPNTDTRLRPDQRYSYFNSRLYEDGRIEEAELEKQRLEQKQREWRRSLEALNETWMPQWFKYVEDVHSEGGYAWVYRGNYWESRDSYPKTIDLF